MNTVKIPGVLYSLALAIAAWAVDYLTTGDGSSIPWAPIAIAAIPVLLKAITVQAPEPAQAVSTARGFGDVSAAPKSKTRKFLLG